MNKLRVREYRKKKDKGKLENQKRDGEVVKILSYPLKIRADVLYA